MLDRKHYKSFFLVFIMLFSLFGLTACKSEDIELDTLDISNLIKSIEEDATVLEFKSLIDNIENNDLEYDIKEELEKDVIGKAKQRLPKGVTFGSGWKNWGFISFGEGFYNYDDIDFLGRSWKIDPFYNFKDELSATIMSHSYNYEGQDKEALRKEMQAIIKVLMTEYGGLVYSENPLFKDIDYLIDNRLYLLYEGDDFYVGNYLINIPNENKVVFTLVYISKIHTHKQNSEYFPFLVHLENALLSSKGYSDIVIAQLQKDGSIINYSKNYNLNNDERRRMENLVNVIPPSKHEREEGTND